MVFLIHVLDARFFMFLFFLVSLTFSSCSLKNAKNIKEDVKMLFALFFVVVPLSSPYFVSSWKENLHLSPTPTIIYACKDHTTHDHHLVHEKINVPLSFFLDVILSIEDTNIFLTKCEHIFEKMI